MKLNRIQLLSLAIVLAGASFTVSCERESEAEEAAEEVGDEIEDVTEEVAD